MFRSKYKTEEERKEAHRKAKREWARRNRERVRANWHEWKNKKKKAEELRNKYTTEELIANIKEIKKDFKEMSQRAVAAKWGRHRSSLLELVKKYG